MQASGVDEEDAERHGADWYLSRDGQQHGPLTEREISLFAEGGNLRPGDLLWTAGLDGWKPAEAIFDLGGSSEGEPETAASEALDDTGPDETDIADTEVEAGPDEAGFAETHPLDAEPSDPQEAVVLDDPRHHRPGGEQPNGEHVHALVQALQSHSEPPRATLKERVFGELKKYAGAFAYLWIVFVLLTLHAWLGDAVHGAGLSLFILTTINAFIVLQLMAQADRFRFVDGLKEKPLIYSIAYRTLVFGTLVFAFYILELLVLGLVGGGGLSGGLENLGGFGGLITVWFILSVAMIPYFAFKAFERAVGADMIARLLFGRI